MIFPESSAGAIALRDLDGNPTNPPNVQNAYPPPAAYVTSCPITALPSDCTARIEARQINNIVSELLAFAECLDPDGPWDCNSLKNLCAAFSTWAALHGGGSAVVVDGISIVGSGTVADPYKVGTVDGGSY
ncbi:hypothetical protein [Bradyrhizobium elkanii]|uniref:hypothetical protein n=1 Tax=Bradyrhizobium elkanii TaxID=29448 RepID=UPI0004B6E0D4|nr:hypothetical protein [Bradyrhizobium elkanii]WLA79565.1 hypothetical protein QNJ99_29735 [Bradyrhizobium elkanii]